MDAVNSFWDGPQPFVFGALLFVILRTLAENRLQNSFLRQGRIARLEQVLYNTLVRWWLVSRIIVPNVDVEKLTGKALPTGFALRYWEPGDLAACMEIYRLNAPGRFPPEVERTFEQMLTKDEHSMLVVELDGRVVACGGNSKTKGQAWLCYGLIHPDHHQRGIGRLLLLFRFARFEVPPPICVQICAVEASVSYYEQFGFKRFGLWYSENGECHPLAGTTLHPEHRERIIEFLRRQGYEPLPALKL